MVTFAQLLANSYLGFLSFIRIIFYSRFFPIGVGTSIMSGFRVRNPGQIKIGKGCFINVCLFIDGAGGVAIGNNVLIGPNVSIHSQNHQFDDLMKPIKEQGYSKKAIIIEDNVWIGASAVILPGVHIGTGTVVGAGAVVTKSFPKNSVIGGVPAKLIKIRT